MEAVLSGPVFYDYFFLYEQLVTADENIVYRVVRERLQSIWVCFFYVFGVITIARIDFSASVCLEVSIIWIWLCVDLSALFPKAHFISWNEWHQLYF